MAIKNINLINFRSYGAAEFKLHPKLTIIMGPNGAGKTNLLEALYLISNTKSWRVNDRALIKHNKAFFKIQAQTHKDLLEARLQLPTAKTMLINGKTKTTDQYIGMYPAVLFEPGSLNIISGGPENRRRYLNGVLANADRGYFKQLLAYRRALKQRNSLLRTRSSQLIRQQVFAWDIKLVELAVPIIKSRLKLLAWLQKGAQPLYQKISQDSSPLEFKYLSGVDAPDYASALLAQLQSRLEQDIRLGATSCGPHRDDLSIQMAQKNANRVASRGETRTLALVCKLLECSYIERATGIKPLILLDDVLSELDAKRRQFLLQNLGSAQTVITATDLGGLKAKLPKNHTVIKLLL